MVQEDDAVRHVLFQALAGEAAFPALAGDDGRNAFFLEPSKQTPKFRSQDTFVGESAEERLDSVEHDARRTDAVDGMAETYEESLEVVVSRFLDLAALDSDEINCDLFPGDKVVEIETEGADILG